MINNQFQTTLDTPCFSSTWSFFVTKHELGPIQERELDQRVSSLLGEEQVIRSQRDKDQDVYEQKNLDLRMLREEQRSHQHVLEQKVTSHTQQLLVIVYQYLNYHL